jgi:cardiolipin synthase A/B
MKSRRSLLVRFRRTLARVLGQRDSASRVARGVAGGFFAAAFPLPGLQIPLSLLCAWLLRGNKFVSIFPQFISNAGTMLPLAILQFKLGSLFWPGDTGPALAHLEQVSGQWGALAPLQYLKAVAASIGQFGLHAIGPLVIGVLLSGLVMAVLSYPLTVAMVWAWRTSRRRRKLVRRHWRVRRHRLTLPPSPPPGPAEAIDYCRSPAYFHLADDACLLVNGHEAYSQMLAAIEFAAVRVELETYCLHDDQTGRRFQRALIDAAARGVQVRLLYDWVGSLGLPDSFVGPLLQAGVDVRVYHPLVLRRPSWAINRRDHRKVLIVDGEVCFTGGLNISDEYAPVEDGGEGWRDTHVRLAGKHVSAAMEHLFLQGWKAATPYAHSVSPVARIREKLRRRKKHPKVRPGEHDLLAEVRKRGGVPVQILGNEEFRFRRRIHRAYLHAIYRAKRYILIENAYFIPDATIRRALRRAVKRGVVVAVAVARKSDVATAALASRSLYSDLLSAGVRLYEWPRGMLHAKTAVIDDAWAIVGSYNFDHRSLFHQLEVVAVVADAHFATRLRDQTLADMDQCHEVSLLQHELRPWSQMMLESIAHLLKFWL